MPGDTLVAFTDGVYPYIDQALLTEILENRTLTSKEKVAELFNFANELENFDNQSALILSY